MGGASPSRGCSVAATLVLGAAGQPEHLTVSGSNEAEADTSQSALGGCRGATTGPDVWYELDLSRARATVDVRVVLDAGFDAALDLRRGPCGDSVSLHCDRASALGRPSSVLHAELEPGSYWLVVSGRDAASRGSFVLQVAFDAQLDECRAADACADALRLDTRALQTTLLPNGCSTPDDAEPVFFYELDLRGEDAPVLATLSSWRFAARGNAHLRVHQADTDSAGCGASITSSWLGSGASHPSDAELNALLSPGRYFIEVGAPRQGDDGQSSPIALTLRLDRETCRAGPKANTCATAIELDTSAGLQVVEGATFCNSDQLTLEPCDDTGAPEQFYRLDLSREAGPTRVRLAVSADGIDFSPLLYVLTADAAGNCGRGLYCFDSISWYEGLPDYQLTLEPKLYFVGVDSGITGSSGRYRLWVELAPIQPSPCVNAEIDFCVSRDDLTHCCSEPQGPGCLELVTACGLAPETRACVCNANAACCGEEGDRSSCPDVFRACSFLCPDFAPSAGSCLALYP
jgi:hypothetical protein